MAWFDQEGRPETPLPDEWRTWLGATEAFGHLANGVSQDLVNALLQQLIDGRLVAAAAEARWRERGRRKVRYGPIAISPDWWVNALNAQNYGSPIWSRSEVSLRIPLEFNYDAPEDDE